jgi:cell wall-associated protease
MYGIGVDRALRELLAGRAPKRRVVVAVIDGGIDTLHPQLAPVLWRNPREIAGNGRDDDNNGYVDDVRGWSTMPSLPGDSGRFDTLELTRLYAACRGLPAGRGTTVPDSTTCRSLVATFDEKNTENAMVLSQIRNLRGALERATTTVRAALKSDTLRADAVRAWTPTNASETQAKAAWLQFATAGLDSVTLSEAFQQYDGQVRFGLNPQFDPRSRASAGSPDVMGPGPRHGTHVAGIIAAASAPGRAVRGVAPGVTVLPLRTVPDGDERDADVARAIRYAVDQGALVVNMSFGKGFSPGRALVDSAVAYATRCGVLLVHAAGNDGDNTDTVPSFPTPQRPAGTAAPLWLEVGASSWKGADRLAAPFSNFGSRTVDLFAPGEDIESTVPGGGTAKESGTSMAAPVVSGTAALLLAYFPSLSPAQVRGILLETVRPMGQQPVAKPGETDTVVPFASLSRTGGLLDAYAAVKLALALETRP